MGRNAKKGFLGKAIVGYITRKGPIASNESGRGRRGRWQEKGLDSSIKTLGAGDWTAGKKKRREL